MEGAIKAGQDDAIPEKLAAFDRILADAVQALEVLGKDEAPPDAPESDRPVASPKELTAALEELLPHLKTKKPKPSKEALEKADSLGWPAEHAIEFAEIGKLIKKYKFKEALPLTESLIGKLQG